MITDTNAIINIGTSGPYISTGKPLDGMVRYAYGRLEVYDGSVWTKIGESDYTLSHEVIQVLQWAQEKMEREQELNRLSLEHPAVCDLLKQINEKQQQLDMVIELIKNHDEQGSDVGG